MKLLIIFSIVFAAVTANPVPVRNVLPVREALGLSPKIISGQPAAEGQFPWQTLDKYVTATGTYICGGALVTPYWILTAAHCTVGAYYFEITLGSLRSDGNIESHVLIMETTIAYRHDDYVPALDWNDIALIKLPVEVPLSNYIQLIQLSSDYVPGGVEVTVSGWGKTSDDSNPSAVLNFVNLATITNQECAEVYDDHITDGSLCCVGAPEHSTCAGDSGGPLVQYKDESVYHVGVASFVHVDGCASGNPSGHSRTSYYLPWIANMIDTHSF